MKLNTKAIVDCPSYFLKLLIEFYFVYSLFSWCWMLMQHDGKRWLLHPSSSLTSAVQRGLDSSDVFTAVCPRSTHDVIASGLLSLTSVIQYAVLLNCRHVSMWPSWVSCKLESFRKYSEKCFSSSSRASLSAVQHRSWWDVCKRMFKKKKLFIKEQTAGCFIFFNWAGFFFLFFCWRIYL